MLQQRLSSLSHRASDTRVSGISRDFHFELPGTVQYIFTRHFSTRKSASVVGQRGGDGSRFGRLKTDFVVNRIFQPLLAAKV
jgi:hypothetical protein